MTCQSSFDSLLAEAGSDEEGADDEDLFDWRRKSITRK